MNFTGAEANLAEAVRRIETAGPGSGTGRPAWLQALEGVRLPLYDVHWPAAVVLDKRKVDGGETIRVGLRDGRIMPLTAWNASIRRALKAYDVVLVRLVEASPKPIPSVKPSPNAKSSASAKSKPQMASARAELRVRPTVQGAAVVLENKSGRILAMAGGFSYPLSQLNRTTQAHRQPGSAFKPLVYLAALGQGLQPNTLIWDTPVTLPPVGGFASRAQDYWTPKNYDGGSSGTLTLRRGLENSKNLVTARLLDGGIAARPEDSLNKVCALAREAQLYTECMHYYPFVLGAQPVRPIDLAGFYAAVANEGGRPTPYAIESIEQDGKIIYQHDAKPLAFLGSADRVAFYQLKTMLQGVLARGTARRIAHLAPYVGGKTGTSDEENDTWFVGFSNDVTVAVWAGYDNADGKRRTLGGGATGGSVAVPMFAPIMQAAWSSYTPRTALAPASKEAMKNMVAKQTGSSDGSSSAKFTEYFRTDKSGRIAVNHTRLANGESNQRETKQVRSVRAPVRSAGRPDGSWAQGQPSPWNSGWGSWNDGWSQGQNERSRPLQRPGSSFFRF